VAGTATAGALVISLAAVSGIWSISTKETGERAHTILERGDVLWTTAADDSESTAAIRARARPPTMAEDLSSDELQTSWREQNPRPPAAGSPLLRTVATSAPLLEPIDTAPEPKPAEDVAVAGLWVPDVNACSFRSFREGLLPTIINNEGAWAGETFCLFKSRKPIASGWLVAAECSGDGKHWSVQVRLTLKGNQMTWESRRGRQVYTRCTPDLRMAEGQ
jgi:hypothetical protein